MITCSLRELSLAATAMSRAPTSPSGVHLFASRWNSVPILCPLKTFKIFPYSKPLHSERGEVTETEVRICYRWFQITSVLNAYSLSQLNKYYCQRQYLHNAESGIHVMCSMRSMNLHFSTIKYYLLSSYMYKQKSKVNIQNLINRC